MKHRAALRAALLAVVSVALPSVAQPLVSVPEEPAAPAPAAPSTTATPAPPPAADWSRRGPRLVEEPWDGRALPPGAVLTKKPDRPLFVTGIITLGLGYVSFLTLSILGNFVPALRDPNGLWNSVLGIELALTLPVAGPTVGFLMLRDRSPALAWAYLASGLAQLVGAGFIIATQFWPVHRVMRPAGPQVALLPGAAGAPLGATVLVALP